MHCPFCQNSKTEVYNSRLSGGKQQVWRRRRCKNCQKPFTTYENVDLSFLNVRKNDGQIEPYMRSKLCISIYKACIGLSDQADDADALCVTIEQKLLKKGWQELASEVIAETALETLKAFNAAAFMRYLSHRMDFSSQHQLQQELQKLG